MEITYLSDSAKILILMKRFQIAVQKIRKQWEVPNDGFKLEDRANGHAKIYWTGEKDDGKYDYFGKDNELIPPTKLVRSELRKLSAEFNLDYKWHSSIYFYILGGGELTPPVDGAGLDVRINDARLPKEEWVVKKINIDIYQDTTIGDIRKIWEQVKEYQKMMPAVNPNRKRTSDNVQRYIKVRELEEIGKSHQEISEIKDLYFNNDAKAVGYLKDEMEKRFSKGKFKKIRYLTEQ